MNDSLARAKELLETGKYTCVLIKDDDVITTCERGVKPLLNWMDEGISFEGYSAADKVVGNGAAFLYVRLNVKEVYSPVMSRAACDTLKKNDIEFICDVKAEHIQNRAGTGNCPVETAVSGIKTPAKAEQVIRDTLKNMAENSRKKD